MSDATSALLAYGVSGLCRYPVEIKPEDGDDGSDSYCHNKCFSHKAERVKTRERTEYFVGRGRRSKSSNRRNTLRLNDATVVLPSHPRWCSPTIAGGNAGPFIPISLGGRTERPKPPANATKQFTIRSSRRCMSTLRRVKESQITSVSEKSLPSSKP